MANSTLKDGGQCHSVAPVLFYFFFLCWNLICLIIYFKAPIECVSQRWSHTDLRLERSHSEQQNCEIKGISLRPDTLHLCLDPKDATVLLCCALLCLNTCVALTKTYSLLGTGFGLEQWLFLLERNKQDLLHLLPFCLS